MIMDLLGPNLEELLAFCGNRFSLKTVLMIAEQLITRIEHVHSKYFVHRDVMPKNFLVGLNKRSPHIYLVDFSIAKRYKDPKAHQHIPYKENKNLMGRARYASINSHLGIEQSRRDDLESLGYMLVYFLKGKLPWQDISANNKAEKYHKIMEKKMSIPIEHLCLGIPTEFAMYLHYCRSLRFDDRPDYGILKKMFRELMARELMEYDCLFDWTYPDPTAHLREDLRKSKAEEVKAIAVEPAKSEVDLLEHEAPVEPPQEERKELNSESIAILGKIPEEPLEEEKKDEVKKEEAKVEPAVKESKEESSDESNKDATASMRKIYSAKPSDKRRRRSRRKGKKSAKEAKKPQSDENENGKCIVF
eukprot:TRINITY_DN3263_c0_g2_i3.p1 TRINITY_DN3263_c0_g2~~TRINITY_DN3263_c0_g2_i3.p1  ORF type:complete len:361 (-),score=131.68 TRINITY_DN3263_c0_g2_i3:64-1146(-)